jgi:membrane fusion protein (multidrug efflux system)
MQSVFRSIAVITAVLVLSACAEEAAPPAPPPPQVEVITVQPQTVSLQRDLVGRLAPFRSADVRARVAGVLRERTYEEGSDVKEGDVMFRIDPAPLQASLAAAQAALAQAQATATNSKVAAERGRGLVPKNYISKSDMDNLEAAERSADAAVQQARSMVTSARINLDYATVRAPISGRAGKQQVTEGALVGEGTATLLTTVDQIDPLYVNFSMSASEHEQMMQAQDAGNVALAGAGQTSVQVAFSDGTVYGQEGTLDFSSTVVDPATGAISLRAQVPNEGQRLLPGMFVTLKVRFGERHNTFLVPQAAVLRDATGPYAMVLDASDTVVRKTLTTDSAQDGQWLVTAGLAAGDRVIVSGVQKVTEGSPAVVAPPKAEGAAPTDANAAAEGAPAAGSADTPESPPATAPAPADSQTPPADADAPQD